MINRTLGRLTIRIRAIALLGAVIMGVVSSGSAWPLEMAAGDLLGISTGDETSAGQLPYEPDHVLVQFQRATSLAERQSAHGAVGAVVVNRLPSIRLDIVRLQSPDLTAPDAVTLYETLPGVTHASLNYYMAPLSGQQKSDRQERAKSASETSLTCESDPVLRAPDLPNDPKFCDQWALHNDGTVDLYDNDDVNKNLPPNLFGLLEEEFDIDALEGWSLLKPASERETIRVAILDTGIDRFNRDLDKANVVACAQAITGNGTIEEDKCNDHPGGAGSAMASIIGAETNNGFGITGLAPEVELVIAKFVPENDNVTLSATPFADYLAMIEWAKRVGSDIITLEHASSPICQPPGPSDPLRSVYEFDREILSSAHEAGTLIVAGSGAKTVGGCAIPNQPRYPSAYQFVLSVAASNPRGEVYQDDVILTNGTQCNETVDIMAPGEWVWTAAPNPTENPNCCFGNFRGPAPAAAYASGVAALLMSEGLTNRDVRELLLATATEVEEHPYRLGDCAGLGQVNLAAALEAIQLEVAIDIKPGSDDNTINTKSQGTVPVAILSTGSFDAANVDVSSVTFGPSAATAIHSSLKDSDGDGDLDLVLHFEQSQTGISSGETEACLTGPTTSGRSIRGCDRVTVR